MDSIAIQEIKSGQRFGFGKNWARFLNSLNDEKIKESKESLLAMVGAENLDGKSFLDIGSGSGLSSLSAKMLGSKQILSFDFDPFSVECTQYVKQKYFSKDTAWRVTQGSILDKAFTGSLGKFDCVYSWGVLHHTGKMYAAFENTANLVAENGILFIAIYNDQGTLSKLWTSAKKIYNRLPRFLRPLYATLVMGPREIRSLAVQTFKFQPQVYLKSWYKSNERGMSRWFDIIDWIGGYPFEVAKPEEVIFYFKARGFDLIKMKTCAGGLGCNEFVFRKKNS